jgi:hypothetical protein
MRFRELLSGLPPHFSTNYIKTCQNLISKSLNEQFDAIALHSTHLEEFFNIASLEN